MQHLPERRIVILAFLIMFPSTSFAYIDPGAGMLLLQGAIAAVAAALVFIRKPWAWLSRKFRFRKRRDA